MRPQCSASPLVWPPQQTQISTPHLTPLSSCIFNPSLQQYVYFISIFSSLGLFHVTSIWLNISLADKHNIAHFKNSSSSNTSNFLKNLYGVKQQSWMAIFHLMEVPSTHYDNRQVPKKKKQYLFLNLNGISHWTLGSKACRLNMKESIAFFGKALESFNKLWKRWTGTEGHLFGAIRSDSVFSSSVTKDNCDPGAGISPGE